MDKKPIGVLLLHGITGTPESMRPVAIPLEAMGLPCLAPTLRGHGEESPEHLRHFTWQQWMEDAENALSALLDEAETAIVVGHSMGGMIALNLAADHGDDIDSIVVAAGTTEVVSPLGPGKPLHFLFPLVARLVKQWDMTPSYADPALAENYSGYAWAPTAVFGTLFDLLEETDRRLPDVHVPTLILHSRHDSANSPKGVERLYNSIATPDDQKRIIWFEQSDHQLFLDSDREAAIQAVVDFVKERSQMSIETVEEPVDRAVGVSG